MKFDRIQLDPNVTRINKRFERVLNAVIRGMDDTRSIVRIGGRKAPYDDLAYEFLGGPPNGARMVPCREWREWCHTISSRPNGATRFLPK